MIISISMESNYGKYLFCSWIFSGFLYETAKVASFNNHNDLQPLSMEFLQKAKMKTLLSGNILITVFTAEG